MAGTNDKIRPKCSREGDLHGGLPLERCWDAVATTDPPKPSQRVYAVLPWLPSSPDTLSPCTAVRRCVGPLRGMGRPRCFGMTGPGSWEATSVVVHHIKEQPSYPYSPATP